MQELEVVSDQNIAIEMFLIRLLHLKEIKEEKLNDINKNYETSTRKVENDNNNLNLSNNISVKKIKNFSQEEQLDLEKKNIDDKISNEIQSFDALIEICNKNKELKLKYELETNVNLVRFENQLIEISFNDNLDKNFVKDLSEKLFSWTSKRWIITFSKKEGMITKKQNIKKKKENLISTIKNDSLYKKIIEIFPDSELINVIEESKDD